MVGECNNLVMPLKVLLTTSEKEMKGTPGKLGKPSSVTIREPTGPTEGLQPLMHLGKQLICCSSHSRTGHIIIGHSTVVGDILLADSLGGDNRNEGG